MPDLDSIELREIFAEKHNSVGDSYLNSLLYYKMTGRKGSYIYQDTNSLMVVCEHPHIKNRKIIFPELGKADYKLTAMVLNMLEEPENGIQLARTTFQNIEKLKEQLSFLNSSKEIDVKAAEEDTLDWRFPVRVLDTEKVANMEGAEFAKIRNKHRIACGSISTLNFENIDPLRAMRSVLKYWEGSMIYNSKDTADMSEFYEEFFRILEYYKGIYDGLIYMEDKKPVGFAVWEELGTGTANLFINLGDSSITGLSDFQVVTTCQKLNDKGIGYLNLGGSEIKSLDDFKAKYQPVETIPLLSAEVRYEQPSNSNIQIQTLVPAPV